MAIVSSDIIDTGFSKLGGQPATKAIGGKESEVKVAEVKVKYPKWAIKENVKRLDYDEFNSCLNLQMANF